MFFGVYWFTSFHFLCCCYFFFCNATATTEIYTYGHTLSLHDALPICRLRRPPAPARTRPARPGRMPRRRAGAGPPARLLRSEEHTSELQSLMRISYAVFCLKKKRKTNNRQYCIELSEHTIVRHI